MFKTKFIISIFVFILLLTFTSMIKNETRMIEKNISKLSLKITSKEINLNEAQLDYHYLTSPEEIEKRLNQIGFINYQPISYSKIFFDISDLLNLEKKISNLKSINEKKIKKHK